ncbi:coproporphyrinogen-III oxidase [Tsuneonella deserti]|uniref:Coproporphyrinogen-III oxidase n=1 Tax=Tsuneonella deserti TaxID=2035528 RepID=A0ABQ1SCF1_9SPHN|nr:oxygen-independent coproporphyrinogen III oxidase [Tsuneonella deserti]GGE00319.1 coproporphyrinogen-III oxidase [Tsuneonella deserti]
MTYPTLSRETFTRYATANVPRYTSYPTAPAFSPAVGEAEYRAWLEAIPDASGISVYVHVPFCRAMCLYCGCHTTVTARDEPIERYLDALEQEIDLAAAAMPKSLVLKHLHFGGGSPTLVPPERMTALMQRLRGHFQFASDAEIAIEVDPRTLSPKLAEALGQAGFNRASVGVQSFDPAVQMAINRVQSFEVTRAAIELLRQAGLARINLDLIYGLPHQTVESCRKTVAQALELAPDRFAVFGYAHVPAFKKHQRRIDEGALPGTDERLAQSQAIGAALTDAGFAEIGLDHYARTDDPLAKAWRNGSLHRNFQGYTTDSAEVLVGFGSSAIGHLPHGYVQNTVLNSDYLTRVAEGRLPVARGYGTSAEDRVRAAVIERIMCDHKVDLEAVCGRFAWAPESIVDSDYLAMLETDGLLRRRGSVLEVTTEAYPLVRSVAAAFDASLAQNRERYSRAV